MAPEVATFLRGGEWERGAHFPAKPSADLYAFGALLYEALTDCHPFNPRLPAEMLLLAIELVPPAEPLQLDPRVPSALSELVMRLLAKDPEQRPPSARAVHGELVRMLEREGDTEAWRAPYAFAMASEEAPPVKARGSGPPASPERQSPVAAGADGREGAEPEAGRHREGWRRGLAVLALILLLLLGIGWGVVRTACASVEEAACSGAASTALVEPAPFEKGCDSLRFSTSRSFGETLALFCAATRFLACAGAPVRPDTGGFLEQCPPEARQTAVRLGFEGRPFTNVELTTVTDAGVGETGLRNVRSGPVEGWMILPGERIYRVTGEARVLPDRVYVQFDRIYLDALYPTPGRAPSPICGVVVSERDRTKFGVQTHAASPARGVEVDPAKVDPSPDATVINAPMVDTYVQLPGRRFPD
jgi:serine/threonine-protein kinase